MAISKNATRFSTSTLPPMRNTRWYYAIYPMRASTLAARRDNARAAIATFEKRLASLQEHTDRSPLGDPGHGLPVLESEEAAGAGFGRGLEVRPAPEKRMRASWQ